MRIQQFFRKTNKYSHYSGGTMRELTDIEKKLLELAHRLKAGERPEDLKKELIEDGMPADHADGMVRLAARTVV